MAFSHARNEVSGSDIGLVRLTLRDGYDLILDPRAQEPPHWGGPPAHCALQHQLLRGNCDQLILPAGARLLGESSALEHPFEGDSREYTLQSKVCTSCSASHTADNNAWLSAVAIGV